MSNQEPTSSGTRPGLRFVLTAAILSVSLFGILRIPVIEQYLLLPFTNAQHGLACRIGGDPDAQISVGLSCSASDVIALCLGFILAFPVAWKKRLLGAVLGLGFIAAVNTVRIATLSHAVRNREWFDMLHVYIWPGVLLIVVSLFVFLWMSFSLRGDSPDREKTDHRSWLSRVEIRFVLWTLVFVALFVGTSSWWMHSKIILAVADGVAATGAFVIRLFGGEAKVSGNALRTAAGGFAVTQECIMTPLIPAYFAAVFAFSLSRRQRLIALLLAVPVFFVLGAARLLVLAFPTHLVGSQLVAIHGFYQVLLGAVLVAIATIRTAKHPRTFRRLFPTVATALVGGGMTAYLVGWSYRPLVLGFVDWLRTGLFHPDHGYSDPQGAMLMMIPFQFGLFVGLWIAWRRSIPWQRAVIGLVVLAVTQPVVLILIGEWASHTEIAPHVAAIRAWSLVSVLLIGAWVVRRPRTASARPTLAPAEPQHG